MRGSDPYPQCPPICILPMSIALSSSPLWPIGAVHTHQANANWELKCTYTGLRPGRHCWGRAGVGLGAARWSWQLLAVDCRTRGGMGWVGGHRPLLAFLCAFHLPQTQPTAVQKIYIGHRTCGAGRGSTWNKEQNAPCTCPLVWLLLPPRILSTHQVYNTEKGMYTSSILGEENHTIILTTLIELLYAKFAILFSSLTVSCSPCFLCGWFQFVSCILSPCYHFSYIVLCYVYIINLHCTIRHISVSIQPIRLTGSYSIRSWREAMPYFTLWRVGINCG